MGKIEFGRGAIMRIHPSGMKVAMYVDEPGVYYDETNELVGEEVAKRAGFDVVLHKKERIKLERMEQFRRQLDDEFAEAEEMLEKLAETNAEGAVIREVMPGQWNLYDSDGTKVTRRHMTEEEAHLLLKSLREGTASLPGTKAPEITADDKDKAVEQAKTSKAKKPNGKAGSAGKDKATAGSNDTSENDLV